MSDAARRDRQDAMLAELSELGLSLARELHARALAAETAQDADKLALAFQRTSRGVRQTLALELKLDRDRRASDREAAQDAAEVAAREAAELARRAEAERPAATPYSQTPVGQRERRVRRALNRLIWDEAEGDEQEYDILTEDLEARLDEANQRSDFLDLPIATLIRQLKADMRLSGQLVITACEAPSPDPSPPVGEGGLRSRSDEGSTGLSASNTS